MITLPSLVYLDERGQAWVEGANTKVKEIVLDFLAHGYSPAEIHFQYPHLSLAQIHAAFAYYYEHQSAMDTEIEREYQEVQEMRAQAPPSLFAQRMRVEGRLP